VYPIPYSLSLRKLEVSSLAPPAVLIDVECFNVLLQALARSRDQDAIEQSLATTCRAAFKTCRNVSIMKAHHIFSPKANITCACVVLDLHLHFVGIGTAGSKDWAL
jgi:hypothetical protein